MTLLWSESAYFFKCPTNNFFEVFIRLYINTLATSCVWSQISLLQKKWIWHLCQWHVSVQKCHRDHLIIMKVLCNCHNKDDHRELTRLFFNRKNLSVRGMVLGCVCNWRIIWNMKKRQWNTTVMKSYQTIWLLIHLLTIKSLSLLSGSSWSFRSSGSGRITRYRGSARTAWRERVPRPAWTFCE